MDDQFLSRSLSGPLRHAVGRFFDRAKTFLKEAILAGAMALNGPDPLDEHDLAEVDHQHAVQVGFMDRFRLDVEHMRTPAEIAEPSGLALVEPMTAAQFVARAESYGASIWGAAQAVGFGRSVRSGATHARRVHVGSDVPCDMCQSQETFGWLPIGDPRHLPIGACTCHQSCHCHYEVQWPDGTSKVVGGKRAA